jgi:N,N'-diacetylchitobiose transport system substrate-binding protein
MRFRITAVIIAALALGVVVATTAGASTKSAKSNTLTVWLMGDAQTGWPSVVAGATTAFKNANPGWNVDVQYQDWGSYQSKFNATIAGNDTPDVIEFGNTQTTEYMADGVLTNLTAHKSLFQNSGRWLSGLKKSSTYNGKLYAVPYYAGSRLITYRTDLFKQVGVTKAPTSLASFEKTLGKVGTKNAGVHGFKPFYMAGTDWYSALSFVADYGGSIATLNSKGKWVGQLESPKSIAGLTAYKTFFLKYSPHSAATLDEAHPAPYDVYSTTPVGHAAAIFGPGWYSCCTGSYKTKSAQFIMPSHVAGKPMPSWLGGSDLAVPVQSHNQAKAMAWIADYTNTKSEKGMQAVGNIPNATNLLDNSLNDRAAKVSWFVPTAKHWADVESKNYVRTMLAHILTGTSVKAAATQADKQIAATLNKP